MKKLKIHSSGDESREKIIQAAKSLFLKKGFEGTSISEIARKAQVNHSLIFHHFNDKAQLWKLVKTSLVEKFIHGKNTAIKNQTLNEFLKQTVKERFELYDKNPDIIRLIHWQRLENNKSELQAGNKYSPDNWIPLIIELQNRGEIRKDFNAEMIAIFIASGISGALMDQHAIFEKSESNKQKYCDMIIEGLTKALK